MSELTSHHKARYGSWAGFPDGFAAKPENCAHEVFRDYRHLQCPRKRGYGPEGAYCKQHDPEAVAKKRAERDAKWEAEWKEKQRQHARNAFKLRFEAALRVIAAGHNYPRSLAAELIAEFDAI